MAIVSVVVHHKACCSYALKPKIYWMASVPSQVRGQVLQVFIMNIISEPWLKIVENICRGYDVLVCYQARHTWWHVINNDWSVCIPCLHPGWKGCYLSWLCSMTDWKVTSIERQLDCNEVGVSGSVLLENMAFVNSVVKFTYAQTWLYILWLCEEMEVRIFG